MKPLLAPYWHLAYTWGGRVPWETLVARGRRHLTLEEKRDIVRDYESGMKFEAIAAAHNIATCTVDRICKKMGVKQRGAGRPRRKAA